MNIAILGLHNWYHSFTLGKSINTTSGVEFKAIADENKDHLDFYSKIVDVENQTTDYDKVIEDDKIDSVIITSDIEKHLELAQKAINEEKHILLDKPIGIDVDESEKTTEMAEESDQVQMVAYPYRYMFMFRKAKEILEEGKIGKPLSIEILSEYRMPSSWPTTQDPGWFIEKEKAGGGGFLDHAVHQFDLLQYLTGSKIEKVSGTVDTLVHKSIEVDDYGKGMAKLEDGTHGTIKSTWSSGGGRQEYFAINAEKGSITADAGKLVLFQKGELETTLSPPSPTDYVVPSVDPAHEKLSSEGKSLIREVDPYKDLFQDFVKAIENNEEPPITFADGLESLKATMGVYKSSEENRSIALSEL